jgi:hypothetical protein
MRVSDEQLAEVWDQGFTVVEGFLDPETLKAAQQALWTTYPRPEAYFADPEAHPRYAASQFGGIRLFPYKDWALNRVPVYPDLTDAAERLLESRDIEIYKVELWAKYAGAINYDQAHHRDYGNHTLVVPRRDAAHTQMTTFILLSDVTELDGPTKIVPLKEGLDVPLVPNQLPFGEMFDKEVSATAPAGSLLIYKTDVLHRGSDFKAPGRSRFVMLVDFQERGWRWNGKMSWPDHAERHGMTEAMVRMTPRQRDLFGWPPIGSDYWNAQTLADVAARYPGIDLSPYAEAIPA